MNEVEVTELIVGDEGFSVTVKDAPSKLLGNIPMIYIWIRMQYEKHRYFLLEWRNEGDTSSYYQIPRGTEVGGHTIGMSDNFTIYNETRAIIGSFQDVSQDTESKRFLVTIYPPRH